MKKILLVVLFSMLLSCNDDDNDRNSFLPNVPVNFSINLNLPEGNSLLNAGYKIFEDRGNGGVIVFNNGLSYTAFDLACPHVPLQTCSIMTFSQSDLYMKCPCDDEEFSKIDGAPKNPEIQQAAKIYTVTKNGNTLYVRN